jgi:hypothetical protein
MKTYHGWFNRMFGIKNTYAGGMLDGLDRILHPTSKITCATRFTELINSMRELSSKLLRSCLELSNVKDLVPI